MATPVSSQEVSIPSIFIILRIAIFVENKKKETLSKLKMVL